MKKVVLLILVGLLVVSCSPCKRLTRKCPPQIIRERYDSIVIKDTVIYKDRIVEMKIPGDTVWSEKLIPGIPEKINVSPLILENDYAKAKAWVENSKLKLQLEQKDQVIKFKLDSADRIAKHWEYRYTNERQTEIVKEKYIPKVYKFSFYILLVIIILTGVYLYIKIKTGGLVNLKKRLFKKG